jgi:FkbM family methyltransferase
MKHALVEIIRHPIFKPFRKVFRGIAFRWPYPVPTTLYTSQRIFVDLRSAIGRGIFVTGNFDREIGQVILEYLNPGDGFIDVGANIGCYSILALNNVGKDGAVFAFEVDPRSLRCLFRSKIRFGYENLSIHAIAAGAKVELVNIQANEEMGNTYVLQQPGGHFFPMLPLDVFMPVFSERRVRVLKVDVEGAELDVLRGATQILTKNKPVIIIEVIESHMARFGHNKDALILFLKKLGYAIRPVEGSIEPCWVCLPQGEETPPYRRHLPTLS